MTELDEKIKSEIIAIELMRDKYQLRMRNLGEYFREAMRIEAIVRLCKTGRLQ